ncbi:MAG TPA: alpha/beta fold hydrolase [Acidimicrobiales bacterium]|nr:alpha/beta fold hydrolase [Acidimicrobiales bacterium]
MLEAPATSCVNHRRRTKVAACGACGRGLCTDCIVHTPVGVKCRRCTGVKAGVPSDGAHVSAGVGSEVAAGARRRPWATVLVVAGLAVVAASAFALMSRDTSPAPTETVDAALTAEFVERHTTFPGPGGHDLGGTLTLPGAAGARVPAVLIIPGLGAMDRNTVSAATTVDTARDALVVTVGGKALGEGDDLYRDLSESLARAGIASFRYDRRGTNASPLPAGRQLTLEDEVGDARAALALLGERQEVGEAPLAVIGHDTGGLVAMRLAAAHPRVRAVVAVSTPGRPPGEVVADELARSRGAPAADQFRAAVATLTSTGKAPTPETLPELLRPIFAPGQDAYLGAILTLDPVAEAARVPVPVLLVRGGGDKGVTAADTDRLAAVLRSGSETLVGSALSDHNLSTAGSAGHVHSNAPVGPVDHRDADARDALSAWVKARLGA